MFSAVLDNAKNGVATEHNLVMLSEFLRHTDHLREIQAAAFGSAWLSFLLAAEMCHVYFLNNNDPPDDLVQASSFALTVMCDVEIDLHVRMEDLPEPWQDLLSDQFFWWNIDLGLCTPFALLLYLALHDRKYQYHVQRSGAERAMKVWVGALHNAGLDLMGYATQEAETIDNILRTMNSRNGSNFRMTHGPYPEDWRVETGPLGEPYPAYFWRSLEGAPIQEDLAVKLLALVRRVKRPQEAVHFDVPGSWETHQDEAEQPSWNVKTWLASMEDSELAQMKADLEQFEAQGFF